MKQIYPNKTKVSKRQREQLLQQHATLIWFTGLSGSGKSTLAVQLEAQLHNLGFKTYLLDGDNIRAGLNKDLSFTDEGRVENNAVATPFGLVAAAGLTSGAPARAAVRAEAITLTPGDRARVLEVRPHGAHDLVRIEADGVVWRALVPARTPLGETVDVQFQPTGAFAFAAS